MITSILQLIERATNFQQEALIISSTHETSKSRIVLLENSYFKLEKLSLKQDELFRQSLRCVENSLFRASHIMAWSGFIDFLVEKLATNQFEKLHNAMPNWKFDTTIELCENYSDFAIIEASYATKLWSKGEKKVVQGLLSKRNECAHPSDYFPELNETLGYISELLKRIKMIQSRQY